MSSTKNEGVLSPATHFMLRSYKENGFLIETKTEKTRRPKVSPEAEA